MENREKLKKILELLDVDIDLSKVSDISIDLMLSDLKWSLDVYVSY